MNHKPIAELVAQAVFGDQDAELLGCKEIQTPSSLVFRLEYAVKGASKVLFVKLPAEGTAKSDNISQRRRREYRFTKQVKSAFAEDPELDTVSPAGFINEIDGLVTWEVCGDSFQDLISSRLRFRYRRGEAELERLSTLTGKWLRRFHSLGLVEGETDLPELISTYCGDRLAVLARTENSHVSKSLVRSFKRKLSAWTEEALSNPRTRVVLCHNDFSPHNIIVTKTGICVLDFSFSTPGLPAFDVACFWQKLEDLKGSLLRGNRGLGAIQNCFLRAYGTDFDMTRADVKLGLARLVLSKMLTLLNSHHLRPYVWIENRRRYSAYLALLESGFELARR